MIKEGPSLAREGATMGRTRLSWTEKSRSGNGANLGFEEKLRAAADKMRVHMDAAGFTHAAVGLIVLKHDADGSQERHDLTKPGPPTGCTLHVASTIS
jgi:hypothetical protein